MSITTQDKIHVMHLLPSLETGGMENGVVNVANGINRQLFAPSICCLERTGALSSRVRSDVRVFDLQQKQGIRYLLPLVLRNLFIKENVRIVHTHNFYTMLYGVAAARLARIPVVIHGEHGFTEEDSARRKLFRKQLSYFVDDIVTVSESVKKTIVREIGINERKITAAVNGVDDTRFDIAIDRRAKRRTLGIGEHDPVIGTVGRLVPVKDYPTLLRAFSRVITWHANARLLFVGDGRLRAELTALSGRLGLEGKVIFLGQRNDTNELLKIMDIFVLSSLSEGMSNAILEAMMARLPVVATSAGNNALLIKEGVTGRFFPVSDSFALSRVLIDLLGDKNAREAMGTAGYEQVKQQFSLDSMIRRYETIYKYWLRRKGVSRPQ